MPSRFNRAIQSRLAAFYDGLSAVWKNRLARRRFFQEFIKANRHWAHQNLKPQIAPRYHDDKGMLVLPSRPASRYPG